jgi:hypothetical protein
MSAWSSEFAWKRAPRFPKGSPGRKYQGGVVFPGSDVRDESHFLATFQARGSALASVSSGNILDFLGLLLGWVLVQVVAVRAYVQAQLRGVAAWVRLPRGQWPKEWANVTVQACPLVLALHGHPDAGTCWEKHCDAKLQEAGFVPIVNGPDAAARRLYVQC